MKADGLLDSYCDLQNPSFTKVAEAVGFHAARVEQANDLDAAVRECLAQPGPALLDVVTDPMELGSRPPLGPKRDFGMTLYSAKAILSGRAGDVLELVTHL
jgi:pyruvate dehydrogenase (quinone)